MSRPLPQPSPSHSRPLPFPVNAVPYNNVNYYIPIQYNNRPPSPTKRALPLAPSGSTTPLSPPTSSRRPLPAAPVYSRRLQQQQQPSLYQVNSHSNSDEHYSHPGRDEQPPPSPQYGIRDLPSRRATQSTEEPPAPMTVRSATLDLQSSNNRNQTQRIPTQPVKAWPVDFDLLPRPPALPIRDAVNGPPAFHPTSMSDQLPSPNLDDAPPRPSLPHKPFSHPDIVKDNIRTKRQPPRWIPNPPPGAHMQQQHIASPSPLDSRFTRPDIPTIELTAQVGSSNGSDTHLQMKAVTPPAITIMSHDDDENENENQPGTSVVAPVIRVASPSTPTSADNVDEEDEDEDTHLPPPPVPMRRAGGLICGSCGGAIIGRIVTAMGVRWHPGCFRCTVCRTLLEHVSSYERDGRPYCHLDYHEKFAPRCYSCKTAIVEERFITLDDPALGGKRTYHEQHFFCAECGDPFLSPSSKRDGEDLVDSDDVGFTVYRGHPYCEACHVRLRMPKCRKCKRSIRDGMQAVEALGGKWCWGCFVCEGCERPFEEPSFFQREGLPFCERCFSIILKNEL